MGEETEPPESTASRRHCHSLPLTTVIGPLIEVPVLLSLVYVALWLQRNIDWRRHTTGQLESTNRAGTTDGDAKPITEDD